MFIVPIVLITIFYIVTRKLEWRDDVLITGISACWITYFSIAICDIIGQQLGWWTVIC